MLPRIKSLDSLCVFVWLVIRNFQNFIQHFGHIKNPTILFWCDKTLRPAEGKSWLCQLGSFVWIIVFAFLLFDLPSSVSIASTVLFRMSRWLLESLWFSVSMLLAQFRMMNQLCELNQDCVLCAHMSIPGFYAIISVDSVNSVGDSLQKVNVLSGIEMGNVKNYLHRVVWWCDS